MHIPIWEVELLEIHDQLPDEYLDRFTEVRLTLFSTSHFNEYHDVSTTYLGRLMKDQRKDFLLREFCLENDIQLNASCITTDSLLDPTSVRMLFDTGPSKSYKSFHMANQSLHKISMFSTSNKGNVVGNGQHIPVLFVIPVVVSVCGHLFKIYTIVAEIHEGINLVLGMKNMVETEGILSARDKTFKFISRSITIMTMDKLCVQPKLKEYLKSRTPFCEDISGIAIAGLWGPDGEIFTLKIRLKNSHGIVEYVSNTSEEVTFLPKTVIGILDLRSLGYCKVDYEDLVGRMGENFTFFH